MLLWGLKSPGFAGLSRWRNSGWRRRAGRARSDHEGIFQDRALVCNLLILCEAQGPPFATALLGKYFKG